MDIQLNNVEARVLGALVEKDVTTPDYYPLSLNALLNACNQKSNREPVMNLDEEAVGQAIRGLEKYGLAGRADTFDSRVTKYEHRMQEAFNFDRREIAILCVLLLRGPQTPGELRSHSERLHAFDDLGEVETTLQRLMKRDRPLVKVLQRQPGTKESRYAHLLCGDVEIEQPQILAQIEEKNLGSAERIEQLEQEVERIRNELAELRRKFSAFQSQFES